jgi:hypothetical protein
MTLAQAAQQALDVQNARNLSGVLLTFNQVVSEVLWPESRRNGGGTRFVNLHPIATLFLYKLASLNGCECFCSETTTNFRRTLAEVEKLAGREAAIR